MKNKTKSLQAKIIRWVKEAQKKLLLQAWTIQVNFDYDEEGGYMLTTSTPEYLSAVIEVKLEEGIKKSNKQVRQDCYHEMAHVLFAEFSILAGARCVDRKQLVLAEEKLVEVLAKIIAG